MLETSRPPEPSSDSLTYSSGGASILVAGTVRDGHVAAQLAPALVQIRHFGAVVGRPVERGVERGFVGNGDLEARPEVRDLLLVELLLLVGNVAAFAGLPETVALDGVGQDQGRLSLRFDRLLIGVVDLARIVAAPLQAHQVVVAEVRDQVQQLGIFAEEILADVGAVLGDVGLEFAIHHFAHALEQQAGGVARQEPVPILAPDDLQDVPAGAAESGFQFLNDLAVAAHRSVESLQVAVDDEDQVVELLAGGQGERAHRFGFVHLAVAQVRPDVPRCRRDHAAILHVPHETRLVNGVDRTESHGNRREVPEVRHQPRVRVGGQPRMVAQFVAEILEMLLAEPPFEESPRVHAR